MGLRIFLFLFLDKVMLKLIILVYLFIFCISDFKRSCFVFNVIVMLIVIFYFIGNICIWVIKVG